MFQREIKLKLYLMLIYLNETLRFFTAIRHPNHIIITSHIALSIVADNLRALYRVRYYYPGYRTCCVKPDLTQRVFQGA